MLSLTSLAMLSFCSSSRDRIESLSSFSTVDTESLFSIVGWFYRIRNRARWYLSSSCKGCLSGSSIDWTCSRLDGNKLMLYIVLLIKVFDDGIF